MFGSNTSILSNPGKDTLCSLAQILQNISDLSRNIVNLCFSKISHG